MLAGLRFTGGILRFSQLLTQDTTRRCQLIVLGQPEVKLLADASARGRKDKASQASTLFIPCPEGHLRKAQPSVRLQHPISALAQGSLYCFDRGVDIANFSRQMVDNGGRFVLVKGRLDCITLLAVQVMVSSSLTVQSVSGVLVKVDLNIPRS